MNPFQRLDRILADLAKLTDEVNRVRAALTPEGTLKVGGELTQREAEVLEMLQAGDSRKGISLSLGIHLSRVGQIIDNLRLKNVTIPDGVSRVRLRRHKVLEADRKQRAAHEAMLSESWSAGWRDVPPSQLPKKVLPAHPPISMGDIEDMLG
jgi:DNA-binding CsgD family transcriptional regulator